MSQYHADIDCYSRTLSLGVESSSIFRVDYALVLPIRSQGFERPVQPAPCVYTPFRKRFIKVIDVAWTNSANIRPIDIHLNNLHSSSFHIILTLS